MDFNEAILKKRAVLIVVMFFVVFTRTFAAQSLRQPLYVSFALGVQNIDAHDESTAAMQTLSPYDRFNFAERLAVGYFVRNYLVLETALTFFSGYNYSVEPFDNTVHRSIDTLDLLGKWVLDIGNFSGFLGAGVAAVYSDVNNFSVGVDEDEMLPAVWGSSYFLRPELALGIGYQISKRFMFGIAANYVFAKGSFSSSLTPLEGEPTLVINSDSLPALLMVGAVLQIKI